jgi:hypothetical protein
MYVNLCSHTENLFKKLYYFFGGFYSKRLTYLRCKIIFFISPPLYTRELKKQKVYGFNSKVRYKALTDRTRLTAVFCDRVEARNYVKEKGLSYILPRTFQIGKYIDRIDWASFPKEYVIKVSHGSGGMILVTTDAVRKKFPKFQKPYWTSIVIHPDDLNLVEADKWIRSWLKLDYTFKPFRDNLFGYSVFEHQFIVEELIRPKNSKLIDFEFFCYDGHVKLIRNKSYLNEHKMCWYDLNWKDLEINRPNCQPFIPKIDKPDNLSSAVKIAERLSGGVDFVRVDLYVFDDQIKFSEFTPYPAAGKQVLSNPQHDIFLGSFWKVNKYNGKIVPK